MSDETQDADGATDDARALLTAALLGAAIGAGLGLLASRAMTDDSVVAAVQRSGRRSGRALRQRSEAIRSAASDAREAFEAALAREVKELRRGARRQRRRLGL